MNTPTRRLSLASLLLVATFTPFARGSGQPADTPAATHAAAPTATPAGWTAVYRHDADGQPVEGSIDTLIDAIRRGFSIRIGWGWTREHNGRTYALEHVADPIFATVFKERHVSAILESHPLIEGYVDPAKQRFVDPGQVWQCVLVTTGEFNAKIFRRDTGEVVRDFPQKMAMTWFVEYPPPGAPAGSAKPYYQ